MQKCSFLWSYYILILYTVKFILIWYSILKWMTPALNIIWTCTKFLQHVDSGVFLCCNSCCIHTSNSVRSFLWALKGKSYVNVQWCTLNIITPWHKSCCKTKKIINTDLTLLLLVNLCIVLGCAQLVSWSVLLGLQEVRCYLRCNKTTCSIVFHPN